MGKILCPTRGGQGSYRTQDAAIAMAKERGDELVFLYVVDLDFLSKTERAVRPDVVAEEMKGMGEFLLSMAQERARKQGVEADYVLRQGDVRAEVKLAVLEEGATMVVLGQATGDEAECAFAPASLLEFAQEIEAETGVEARVVC